MNVIEFPANVEVHVKPFGLIRVKRGYRSDD